MYIGSTDITGLHHLATEIIDNAVDEVLNGFADRIKITLGKDGSFTVSDNGRGIPVGIKKEYGVSALELASTKLHAGGKFGGSGYKVSGGLHGVGLSVVNALSEYMEVWVQKEDGLYYQKYFEGIPESPVKKIKSKILSIEKLFLNSKTGTTVRFKPSTTTFETIIFDTKVILNKCKSFAYLLAGLYFEIIDEKTGLITSYYFEGGLKSYIEDLNKNKKNITGIFYVKGEEEGMETEIALQYTDVYNETLISFANNIITPQHGHHVTGFKTALTKVINDYAKAKGILKNEKTLTGEDIREGLTAIINIKIDSERIQYEGQTKEKLGTPQARSVTEKVFKDSFATYLDENPKDANAIVEKSLLTQRARLAAKAARDTVVRKGALDSTSLPGKLADCASKKPEECELYIVEGDSAGGCFSGDTQVALADGRNLSFKRIMAEQKRGIEHFCYTIRKDGKVGLEKLINVRITKKNAEVINIYLDNGEKVTCTPDHLFMMRDKTYKKAVELRETDSIMPLYKKLSDTNNPGITINGYEMVWDPKSDKWLFTHILADWYNRWKKIYTKSKGDHCHHIDFNKNNNNPTNINRIPAGKHLELHRKHIGKTLHRPEIIEKGRKLRQEQEYRKKISDRMREPATREILSKQAKKQWESDSYKDFMKQKWRGFYEKNEEYRNQNNKILLEAQRKYWAKIENKQKQSERVSKYFKNNPHIKIYLSNSAKKQWENEKLRKWRSEKTKEQWTPNFRVKRKIALRKTYYVKTIEVLKKFEKDNSELDIAAYTKHRVETKDKSLLKFETFCEQYFSDNKVAALEAITNYNHKIQRIEFLEKRIIVYDVEVPNTHNFALTSGIFVHNSAKQGRDRHTQAVLPLRGKVLNPEKSRLDKILKYEQLQNLIIALGTSIADSLDTSKLRYHKIIIMTDADVDGAHIATLLLTFFYRHIPELIEQGRIYKAQPPLYRVQKGKEVNYVYSDEERDEIVKSLSGKGKGNVTVQRFKGLGEMNADQLWETTMNPKTRVLKRINIEDTQKADEVFTTLMGIEVPPRRKFIQLHAKQAELDL